MPLLAALIEPLLKYLFTGEFAAICDKLLGDNARPGAGHKAVRDAIGERVAALRLIQRVPVLTFDKRLALFWQHQTTHALWRAVKLKDGVLLDRDVDDGLSLHSVAFIVSLYGIWRHCLNPGL